MTAANILSAVQGERARLSFVFLVAVRVFYFFRATLLLTLVGGRPDACLPACLLPTDAPAFFSSWIFSHGCQLLIPLYYYIAWLTDRPRDGPRSDYPGAD